MDDVNMTGRIFIATSRFETKVSEQNYNKSLTVRTIICEFHSFRYDGVKTLGFIYNCLRFLISLDFVFLAPLLLK